MMMTTTTATIIIIIIIIIIPLGLLKRRFTLQDNHHLKRQTRSVAFIRLIGKHQYNRLETSDQVVLSADRVSVVVVQRAITAGLDRDPVCVQTATRCDYHQLIMI